MLATAFVLLAGVFLLMPVVYAMHKSIMVVAVLYSYVYIDGSCRCHYLYHWCPQEPRNDTAVMHHCSEFCCLAFEHETGFVTAFVQRFATHVNTTFGVWWATSNDIYNFSAIFLR